MSSLLGAGVFAVAASQLAHADVAGTCADVGADAFCNVTETISSPSSISFTISVRPLEQNPGYNYTLDCSLGSQSTTSAASGTGLTQYTVNVPLPYTVPDSCTISVTANIETGNALDSISLEVDYSTGSPTTGSGSLVRGYDNKCLDDKGNSSSNGTKVIIWSCNSADSAQGWTFSGGELKHNGKCANVSGGGASGHKLILWSCNGASNEKWFHSSSNGEYVLSGTSNGLLCLDDPGYSKSNGTQLIVYACHNTSNQHWSA
ncbi:MAG: ricin-type beta-trefoil lectin domain protein [Streptosporangiaceae bacterium]